jgi:hypothetical protein
VTAPPMPIGCVLDRRARYSASLAAAASHSVLWSSNDAARYFKYARLPHSQLICCFQHRSAAAADDRAAISAGQRIGNFDRTLRAVKLRLVSALVCHDVETNTDGSWRAQTGATLEKITSRFQTLPFPINSFTFAMSSEGVNGFCRKAASPSRFSSSWSG